MNLSMKLIVDCLQEEIQEEEEEQEAKKILSGNLGDAHEEKMGKTLDPLKREKDTREKIIERLQECNVKSVRKDGKIAIYCLMPKTIMGKFEHKF